MGINVQYTPLNADHREVFDNLPAVWEPNTLFAQGQQVLYGNMLYIFDNTTTTGAVFDINEVSPAGSGGTTTTVSSSFIGGLAATDPLPTGATVLNDNKWKFTTAGTFEGIEVEVGDVLIAMQDSPTTISQFVILQANGAASVNPMGGATSIAAGTTGTVPAPQVAEDLLLLRGDATWALNIPVWAAAVAYPANYVVQASGSIYIRKTQGTSGATFDATEMGNWHALSQYSPNWDIAESYAIDDIVRAGGSIYRAKVADVGTNPATDTAEAVWALIGDETVTNLRALLQSFGVIKTDLAIEANAGGLTLESGSGSLTFVSGREAKTTAYTAQGTMLFDLYKQDGIVAAGTSLLDVANYDNNGALTPLAAANDAGIWMVYADPNNADTFAVLYPQNNEDTLATAEDGTPSYSPTRPAAINSWTLLCAIAARKDANDLSQASDATFFNADKFGNLSSKAVVASLTGADNAGNLAGEAGVAPTPQIGDGQQTLKGNGLWGLNIPFWAALTFYKQGSVVQGTDGLLYSRLTDGSSSAIDIATDQIGGAWRVLGGSTANNRVHVSLTDINTENGGAIANAADPTVAEVTTWAAGNTIVDATAYYTGTDTASDPNTHVYAIDAAGQVTEIEDPDSFNTAHLTMTTVAALLPSPTLVEIQAAVTSIGYVNRLVYYTGTDTSTDPVTHVYWVDVSGTTMLVKEPAGVANNRAHLTATEVAAVLVAAPTLVEIQAAVTTATITDALVYYTGDDLPASAETHIYMVDGAGVATLVQSPSAGVAAVIRHVTNTEVAASGQATVNEATLAEMQATVTGLGLVDQYVYYTGSDAPADAVLQTYYSDSAGTVLLVNDGTVVTGESITVNLESNLPTGGALRHGSLGRVKYPESLWRYDVATDSWGLLLQANLRSQKTEFNVVSVTPDFEVYPFYNLNHFGVAGPVTVTVNHPNIDSSNVPLMFMKLNNSNVTDTTFTFSDRYFLTDGRTNIGSVVVPAGEDRFILFIPQQGIGNTVSSDLIAISHNLTDASGVVLNDRSFADATTVAPLVVASPTLTEIQVFVTAAALTNVLLYYTGDDTSGATPTHNYWVDNSGTVTLIYSQNEGGLLQPRSVIVENADLAPNFSQGDRAIVSFTDNTTVVANVTAMVVNAQTQTGQLFTVILKNTNVSAAVDVTFAPSYIDSSNAAIGTINVAAGETKQLMFNVSAKSGIPGAMKLIANDCIAPATAKNRSHLTETSIAPAVAGAPTLVEVQAAITTAAITDAIVYYTGTDLDSDSELYVYHADANGTTTLIRSPADIPVVKPYARIELTPNTIDALGITNGTAGQIDIDNVNGAIVVVPMTDSQIVQGNISVSLTDATYTAAEGNTPTAMTTASITVGAGESGNYRIGGMPPQPTDASVTDGTTYIPSYGFAITDAGGATRYVFAQGGAASLDIVPTLDTVEALNAGDRVQMISYYHTFDGTGELYSVSSIPDYDDTQFPAAARAIMGYLEVERVDTKVVVGADQFPITNPAADEASLVLHGDGVFKANIPAWTTGDTYKAGVVVEQGGLLYKRIADGVAGATFDVVEAALWTAVGGGSNNHVHLTQTAVAAANPIYPTLLEIQTAITTAGVTDALVYFTGDDVDSIGAATHLYMVDKSGAVSLIKEPDSNYSFVNGVSNIPAAGLGNEGDVLYIKALGSTVTYLSGTWSYTSAAKGNGIEAQLTESFQTTTDSDMTGDLNNAFVWKLRLTSGVGPRQINQFNSLPTVPCVVRIEIENTNAAATDVAWNAAFVDGSGAALGTESIAPSSSVTLLFMFDPGSSKFRDISRAPEAAPSNATIEVVNQVAHGLTTNQAVRYSGGAWVTAQADNGSNIAHGIVSKVTDVDNVVITTFGVATITGHGLTVGDVYWLSQATAGLATDTPPTSGVVQGLFHVRDANTLFVNIGVPAISV